MPVLFEKKRKERGERGEGDGREGKKCLGNERWRGHCVVSTAGKRGGGNRDCRWTWDNCCERSNEMTWGAFREIERSCGSSNGLKRSCACL